jgi:hypothetical protein
MRSRVVLLASLVFLIHSVRSAESATDEAKAQQEFKKQYANLDRVARKAAVRLLVDAKLPSTWDLLIKVMQSDPDPGVQAQAFRILCFVPARDPSLTRVLAKLFTNVKRTDHPLKQELARDMEHLAFKADAIGALVDYISINLRFPEYIDANSSIAIAHYQQKEFEDMLGVFNKIADTNFDASAKTLNQIKKWYKDNKDQLEKNDRDVVEQYRKEDKDAATKPK